MGANSVVQAVPSAGVGQTGEQSEYPAASPRQELEKKHPGPQTTEIEVKDEYEDIIIIKTDKK